jgi:glycosyltransferase involved in cell wall biosynthesis
MRVLIVSYSDLAGGAARGAYRLHECLLKAGVDSRMLVQRKVGDSDRVAACGGWLSQRFPSVVRWLRTRLEILPVRRYGARPPSTVFTPAWVPSRLATAINRMQPDIVHFHWVGWGMLRLEELPRIKAPIVWTLHDMWAFTGGCHYDQDCGKYVACCGACPMLGSHHENDLSRSTWIRKQDAFANVRSLTVVGLSRWLADCAARSSLLAGCEIVNLPNPLDTGFFRPVDRLAARRKHGLPLDKKLILFGATDSTGDPRKGFDKLVAALERLNEADTELVVFGGRRGLAHLPFRSHVFVDFIPDADLVELYAAADVMVVPSLQENLAATIMEPLACGTPVVAFGIGGNVDMIDHGSNGYIARPFDAAELAACIDRVLRHPDPESLRRAARAKVEKCYSYPVMADAYRALYGRLAKDQSGSVSSESTIGPSSPLSLPTGRQK